MEQRSAAWLAQALAGARPLPVARLRTAMGERVWGLTTPEAASAGGAFDAAQPFDADQPFDAGSVVLEGAARLLRLEGPATAVQPNAQLLGAYTASERAVVTVEIHNRDRAMSRLIGEEYVLRQLLETGVTFPGLPAHHVLVKATATVTRWRLRKRSLVLEAETR